VAAPRPENLIYAVEDRPPPLALALLGIQHIFLMSSTLVLPVVLIAELGGSFEQVRGVVALTMCACGLGTIVQATRLRGLGSGFLCPNLCGPNFFAASMSAGWLGGLPLIRGMTIAAGLFEALFARAIRRLGFLFPTEITGLVVLMVGVSLIPLGASKFLGITYANEPISGRSAAVAGVTLLAMVAVNVWGRGRLRLYGVLLGMVLGYAVSFAAGLVTPEVMERLARSPWVALPWIEGMGEISFRWSLLPTFLIVSVTGALKTMGNLTLCEQINDPGWKEPDLDRIGDGLMADALAVTASGLLGGMASDTSASNVALTKASGATSRRIGFVAGGLFLALGFSPKFSGLLSIMPMPVMGAIVVFVTCFMLASGVQIVLASGLDARRTFVVGMALVFGLSLDILPALYADVPSGLRPLFSSSLTLATAIAVTLNQLLRLRPQRPA